MWGLIGGSNWGGLIEIPLWGGPGLLASCDLAWSPGALPGFPSSIPGALPGLLGSGGASRSSKASRKNRGREGMGSRGGRVGGKKKSRGE